MLMRQIDDPRQREYLLSIRQSSRALLTLVNDILDLSKAEAGRFELHYGAVRLRGLIGELATLFRLKLAEKGVGWVVDVAADVPEVLRLDEVRLRQVLLNLLGNAAKFTASGQVRLSVGCSAREGATCGLELAVSDSGIGIPRDKLKLIFEPFEQIDRGLQFGGTGLGLAISRRLVGLMGGEIGVDSEEGRGSRFTVRLPGVEVLADDAEDSLLAAGDGRGGEEVPASLVAAAEPPAAAGFDPLPEAEAARSLLRALEDGPAEQWQTATASAALDIGCLIRFGGELEELGRRHGWQALVQYGARIQSQAAQFELDALPDTLKTFPRLLSLLKSL
jgi:two-component system sensor histidine kinase EvgS